MEVSHLYDHLGRGGKIRIRSLQQIDNFVSYRHNRAQIQGQRSIMQSDPRRRLVLRFEAFSWREDREGRGLCPPDCSLKRTHRCVHNLTHSWREQCFAGNALAAQEWCDPCPTVLRRPTTNMLQRVADQEQA